MVRASAPTSGGRPRVCVLMGGPGGERDVSLATGATIARCLGARAEVRLAELRPDGRWVVGPGSPTGSDVATADSSGDAWRRAPALSASEAVRVLLDGATDVVYNALHGPPGEDGTVQGFLEMHGLAYTGPGVAAAAVTMDKRLTKLALVAADIPTPSFFAVPAFELESSRADWAALLERERERVPLPWVLKPNRLGSSVGVEFITGGEDAAARAAEAIARWPAEARLGALLVESAVSGRELSCAVVETTAGEVRALPPIELRPKHGGFFDYDAKYTPGVTEELCPAPVGGEVLTAVEELSVRVHRLFDCAPLSRTDLFLLGDGRLTVLEVNTLPGMTETSLVPLAARTAGVGLEELVWRIVEHGLGRAGAPIVKRPRQRENDELPAAGGDGPVHLDS